MSNVPTYPYHSAPTVKDFTAFPRYEPIAIDSSALRQFKFCPESYRFRYVLGYTSKTTPIYFVWGSAIHKFFEVVEHKYAEGLLPAACIGFGITAAMKIWGNTEDGAPRSKFAHMTKIRLADVLLHLAGFWQKEKEVGSIRVIKSEEAITMQLPNGQFTSGRPDQLISWNGRLWVRDFKTTTKKIDWYRNELFPNDQFLRYAYFANKLSQKPVAGVMVWVIYVTSTDGPTIFEELVAIPTETIDKWLENQEYWFKALQLARDTDIYPQNEANCKFCTYHSICKLKTQQAKEYTLKQNFAVSWWDNARIGEK